MKKQIFIAVLVFLTRFSFAQTFQKGNLVGVHVLTVSLKPNVTMDQYKTFFISKAIPEYEKQFPGTKLYFAKSVRGENENSFGLIFIFNSEKARSIYFNADGSMTVQGKAANDKVDIVFKELDKLGTYDSKYNDWVVQ